MKRWVLLSTAMLALMTALVTGNPSPPASWSTELLLKYGNPDALLVAQRVYQGWKMQDPVYERGVSTADVRRRLFSTPFNSSFLAPNYCNAGDWSVSCFRRGAGEFLGIQLEHKAPHTWIAVDVAWVYCESHPPGEICISSRQGF
jgi:hypothetical protein